MFPTNILDVVCWFSCSVSFWKVFLFIQDVHVVFSVLLFSRVVVVVSIQSLTATTTTTATKKETRIQTLNGQLFCSCASWESSFSRLLSCFPPVSHRRVHVELLVFCSRRFIVVDPLLFPIQHVLCYRVAVVFFSLVKFTIDQKLSLSTPTVDWAMMLTTSRSHLDMPSEESSETEREWNANIDQRTNRRIK